MLWTTAPASVSKNMTSSEVSREGAGVMERLRVLGGVVRGR